VRSDLRIFVHAAGAEDLTQEVFLNVHRSLATFRGHAKISTWIFQIATHAALDRLRSACHRWPATESTSALDGHSEHATPNHEPGALHTEMCRCIRDLMDELPVDFRTIIHLGGLKELKLGEIAQILDLTPGAPRFACAGPAKP
jgi:RNA polymerase sigma-70 factor (ECF subfamily)